MTGLASVWRRGQAGDDPARRRRLRAEARGILPGFGLTLGLTLAYTSLLVLIPLAGLVVFSLGEGVGTLVAEITAPRALAAYRLSLTASAAAAALDAVLGFLIAWVLVR